MKIINLARKAHHLAYDASAKATSGYFKPALLDLVKLRELLNNEPQLEAGGAITPESEDQP